MPATIAPRHIAATRRASSRRPSFALIAPTRLTFLSDGVATWSTSGPISRRSQFIILSSEVATAFAGSLPVAGYGTRETSTTKLEVDYVRVWEAPRSSTVVEPAVAVSDPPCAAPPAGPAPRLLGTGSRRVGRSVRVAVFCPSGLHGDGASHDPRAAHPA